MDLAAAVFSTLILLVGFWLLVARQIRAAVDGYAIQSILLGCLALALFAATRDPDLLALGILTIAIKGLATAPRRRQRSAEPVSYTHLDVYKRQLHS